MFLFSTTDRPETVQSALRQASGSTGVDFDYLLDTAQRESNLDTSAKAKTSSASGLFQFIESTWLAMMKEAGPRHGYQDAASSIEKTQRGDYRVSDQAAREEILALRHDPKAAALMAGEFTRQNGEALRTGLGREPREGELYIAHFLGAKGAVELIRLAETSPNAPAATQFPAAARANRSIFVNGDGHARGAADVYANLTSAHGGRALEGPEAPQSEMAFAFAPPQTRADQVFQSMFNDNSPAAGLGPIGRSVSAFWGGLYGNAGLPSQSAPATAIEATPQPVSQQQQQQAESADVRAPRPAPTARMQDDDWTRDPSMALPAEVSANLFRVW